MNFKNMAVSISGKDSGLTGKYYADSITISESLGELNFSTLGNTSVGSVTATAPQGTVNLSFYVTTGEEISAITGHYGRTGFIEVQAGPFVATNSLLDSFDIEFTPDSIVKGSMGFTYFGQIHSGSSTPATGAPVIIPAHGAASTLSLQNVGVESARSAAYGFSQSYDVGYSIGGATPARVTFVEMTKTIGIEAQAQDVNFNQSNLTGTSGICQNLSGEPGFSVKSGFVEIKNLCNERVGMLGVTGYLESREFSAAPGENVQQSLNLVETSVEGEC